jgi:hypothetical protein
MSVFKDFIADAPKKTFSFVMSPKFAAILGVGVAVFQFAAAVDQYMAASKGKKQIGFSNDDNSPMSRFLKRDQ